MPSQQHTRLKPVHCQVPVTPCYQGAYRAQFEHYGCLVSVHHTTCSITFPEGTVYECLLDDVPQMIWTLPNGVQVKEIPAKDNLSYLYTNSIQKG